MNIAYDRFPEVWLRSKGVVFLGTPHRGSSTATQAKLFGDIINVAWSASGGRLFSQGINTTFLRDLRPNSSELIAIADSFTQRASALQIVTFYEGKTTPPVGAIVSLILTVSLLPVMYTLLYLLIIRLMAKF